MFPFLNGLYFKVVGHKKMKGTLYFSFKRCMHWVKPKHPETSWKVNVEIREFIFHQNLPHHVPPPQLSDSFLPPKPPGCLVTVLSHGELSLMKPIKNYPKEVRAGRENFWTIGF